MLGFGPPSNRQARRDWWRRQIQRQNDSRQTVADFCRRLGVSPVTFYAWKRRLQQATVEALPTSSGQTATTPHDSAHCPTPTFLPVAIRDSVLSPQIEIELGNQCVVRIKGTIDRGLLRTVIRAAGQLGTGQRGTC
jgi:transposase-like protein